jgi:acyl carrier protein
MVGNVRIVHMGLEGTQLIQAIEEAFGIEIPDEVSRNIRTVGELHEHVFKAIQASDSSERYVTHCLFRLRKALHAAFGYNAEELRPETPLAGLFPPRERRGYWERLRESLDLILPDLRKPRWVHLASLLVLGAGIMSVFIQQEKAPVILPVCIVLAMAIGIMTERLRKQFPSRAETLGGLANRILSLNRRYITLSGGSSSAIMQRIRGLVASHLGVTPKVVVQEARFVEDLGMR